MSIWNEFITILTNLKITDTYKATLFSIILLLVSGILCMYWHNWPVKNFSLLIHKNNSINTLCMCCENLPILNIDFFGIVLNLLEDVMKETACGWWKKAQIYALQSIRFLHLIHWLLLSHLARNLQISKIQRQILQIHMVSAIGWSGVNWQSGHPSLHPCILENSPPILQTVVTMFESKTFNNY